MEYSELNNYLKGLKVKEKEKEINDSKTKDISKKGVTTINYLDRDLNLFNDLNSYNNPVKDNLNSEYQSKQDYKNNDVNSRLNDRGFTPANSVFSGQGQGGPLQNVAIDMTPLATRVISKDKNKNKN
jgi:hypothetical protein